MLLVSINPGGPNGGSATQYFTGQFNGKTFTPYQTDTCWIDYGLFADNGLTVMTGILFPNKIFSDITIQSGDAFKITSLQFNKLKNIYEGNAVADLQQ